MQTKIRKGQRAFYGDSVFPHGIARSGYFNKREAEELELYGDTFEGLLSGRLLSQNREEKRFIANMGVEHTDLYPVRLWQKYLNALAHIKRRHGFMISEARSRGSVVTPDVEVEPDIVMND